MRPDFPTKYFNDERTAYVYLMMSLAANPNK